MPIEGAVLQSRYRILRTLSDKGGMGVVYQAEDQRLGSQVVVKETRYLEMKSDVREMMLKAFFREARLLANLRHSALPRVSDYFDEGDGYFLVMEFVPGKDLEELLEERGQPFAPDDVLQWADRLLEVLDYLHGHDEPIIHRDIKPANLKLTPQGEVMLLDFGLAKGAAAGVQAASSVFGYTQQYAPLEQIKGRGTDARSDLFSLAATLYHLLTADVPPDAFERVSELAIGNPDPLKPVADLNRSVPSVLSAIISQAMALRLDDRPPTASAMRQALRGTALPGTPQPARADSQVPIASRRPPTIVEAPQSEIVKLRAPNSFTDDLNGVKLEMIYVPGGRFTMGSNRYSNEQPLHEVTVPAFYIGKFQITQAQWKAVMGDKLKPNFKGDDLPMESISWHDAQEFCQQLQQLTGKGYRLPSEAEWEYACRAGTTGDYAGDLDEMAWYNKWLFGKTHPVGQKQPNAFGLYDMHGNVWEWCEDVWHSSYKDAPTDGSAWLSEGNSSFRVVRGGSWNAAGDLCRSAYRDFVHPSLCNFIFGFRVVVAARSL